MTDTRQTTPRNSRTALLVLFWFMVATAGACVYGAFGALQDADRKADALMGLTGRYVPSEFPAGTMATMVIIGAGALAFAAWIFGELRKA